MYKVLLVEDSNIYQLFISQALGSGFEVTIADRIETAEEYCKQNKYDILIVDIVLPDGSGVDFCEARRKDDCLVVLLTSQSERDDKVLGWSTGVDDYITKPVDPLELRTRILARVQKFKYRQDRGELVSWHDLELNVTKQSVTMNQNDSKSTIELTPHEFKILYSLIRHGTQTLDRTTIKHLVWGVDVHVTERTVDRHISTIRKKLGSFGGCILTVPGQGYRLVEPSVSMKKSS